MEGFLVSAATGALKAVSVKLATLLGDEYKNLKDVRKEIKPLSDELNRIHAFLEEMSEKEDPPGEQDKAWMTDVREMSYDIEDTLDDFMISFDDGDYKSAKPNKGSLVKKCNKLLAKMKAHQRISKAMQDFKTQIKEVGDRNERYRTGGATVSAWDASERIDHRALVIFNEASELVGVDQPRNELISLLSKDGCRQLNVVSVVGFGGLGKTTIAHQVYVSLKDEFDCEAFVTVSRNPDMVKVLRTILSDVSGKEYTDTEAGDVQHLIKRIFNFLQDKRYIIVVDDLWGLESWDTIKYAFIKNCRGSRIITTTRINEVAESCSSLHRGHIYTLRPLNEVNSRKLFLKRVFGSEEGCPSQLVKVSNDILKKCDGLPLAIIAVAGLLASKARTFDEWNKVQTSFGYALERHSDVNRMIHILSLSYIDLHPHLRSCLLYLSMFPEDYEIRKERLVLRWIAEGFIHEEHGFTQYELGERCFNELINRSLIQLCKSSDLSGIQIFCRVHDTILEFIVSKATEENFVTLFGVPKTTADSRRRRIRRLSLRDRNVVGDALAGLRENTTVYSHVRSVSVFPGSLDSLPSLLKFRHVRVLDLEGCEELQPHHLAHLGRLFALRHLSLCRTQINKLPEEIGELRYLQTLDVRHTGIRVLPSSIVRLARLANLLGHSVLLPEGFRNMQALHKLQGISLSSQSPNSAQELRQLGNLRMLVVGAGEFTRDVAASLCTLGTGRLSSLIISPDKECMDLVMEPWNPTPISLKLLRIWTVAPRVPTWIGSLDNLQNLTLSVDQLGVADVALLGRLNALSCVFLRVWTEVADRSSPSSSQGTQRVKITGAHGLFPSLTKLRVGSRSCGFGLYFEAGAAPKLRELDLHFNGDRTGPLTDGEFDFGIQHLPCLAIVRCDLGFYREARGMDGYEPEHPAWDALKIAVSSNPNHPRLHHCYSQ